MTKQNRKSVVRMGIGWNWLRSCPTASCSTYVV